MRRMHVAAAIAAAMLAGATHAQAVDTKNTWKLDDIYANLDAWNADAKKLEGQMPEFARCAGHLGEGVARFKKCIDLQADMDKRMARLYTYAGEVFSGDTSLPANMELQQRAQLLGTKLGETESFVNPELLKVGRKRIDAFLAQDKSLRIYKHPLDDVLRMASHTLDKNGEQLLASFGLIGGTGYSIHTTLTNAEIPWPKVKLSTGEEVTVDQPMYEKYRQVPNRDDRKLVMDAFFAALKTYERTFGIMLYSQLKEDMTFAKARRYPDSITASVDRNRVPVAIMDTLIAQSNANLPTLHRYFKLRAKMLGVTEMRYYDIYPPLVKSDLKFPIDDSKKTVLDAVAPLGPEYVSVMKKGFDERWMDVYPRKGKQSGAHMAGSAYDVHPYVLLNHNDDYEALTTIAHEMGHAMHSHLSNTHQPFVTSQYATFIAEIASTFNEELLLDHMLKIAKNDDERLFYLGSALEGLRATYFRQAMFAEFERTVHKKADAGEALTGEALTKTYCDILKRYHGDAQGVLKVDDAYCVEWQFIPHFYYNYYVYQYATSIAASSLFAQRIVAKQPGALEKYITLLKAGSSDYPYELVKTAGVDLASPEPYKAIAARMNSIMDDIEKILAKKH
ncbi:MAG TPA: oligoendopeptidase F [Ramlibacter sp.]|nr:oligoendopeptidase F [Ramlibacter sp.]